MQNQLAARFCERHRRTGNLDIAVERQRHALQAPAQLSDEAVDIALHIGRHGLQSPPTLVQDRVAATVLDDIGDGTERHRTVAPRHRQRGQPLGTSARCGWQRDHQGHCAIALVDDADLATLIGKMQDVIDVLGTGAVERQAVRQRRDREHRYAVQRAHLHIDRAGHIA